MLRGLILIRLANSSMDSAYERLNMSITSSLRQRSVLTLLALGMASFFVDALQCERHVRYVVLVDYQRVPTCGSYLG